MLSRANSDAGNRLRRAKSSSSVHYKSYESQAPLFDRGHAEVAAVEAYRRAQRQEHSYNSQLASTRLRHRKHASRRSEGSHFEDKRNGDRLKESQSGSSRPVSVRRTQRSSRSSQIQPSEDHEGKIVTRPRRVVNTNIMGSFRDSVPDYVDLPSRRVHKAQSMYNQRSTVNAGGDAASRRSSLLPDTPYRSVHELGNESVVGDVSESRISISTKAPTRETQTEDEIKAAAWDAYLQGFHNKDTRASNSFVAPIKKRLSRNSGVPQAVQYDSSVPPYNFANDSDDMLPSSIPPVEISEPHHPAKLKKTRVLSESLRSKFKRMLGRPKRVQSSFPAQHVEAKNLHFDVYKTQDESFSADPDYELDLPKSPFSSLGTAGTRQSSARSVQSGGDFSTVKSRVTSWTNSTTVGTVANSSQANGLSSIDETNAIEAVDPASKEPTGSFLGRTLRLRLRRQSQANLSRTAQDGKRLYDALRRRIQGPEEFSENGLQAPDAGEVAGTSPSANRVDMVQVSGQDAIPSNTIRAVTPESHFKANLSSEVSEPPKRPPPSPPSKVVRKPSWWSISRKQRAGSRSSDTSKPPSLRTKRQLTPGLTSPSKEQIAARFERSENRWQSTLEDRSGIESRPFGYSLHGDNPYELCPLSKASNDNSLPLAVRHARIPESQIPSEALNTKAAREQVISPSVYSTRSDCRSATPSGGMEGHGMFITITGHEVKRYPLDSPPRHSNGAGYVSKPSHEWKSWLNKELEDFNTTPAAEELSLREQKYLDKPCDPPLSSPGLSIDHGDPVKRNESAGTSQESLCFRPHIEAPKTRRPELSQRKSSFMNERYPLIETGRPASRTTGSRSAPSNPSSGDSSSAQRGASRPASTETEDTTNPEEQQVEVAKVAPCLRTRVRERQSTSALIRGRKQPSLAARAAQYGYGSSQDLDTAGGNDGVRAPKSALDLRAVYRSSPGMTSSKLNIRRKPMSTVLLEDHTLRRISQGPYATNIGAALNNKENLMPTVAPVHGPAISTFTQPVDGVTIPPFYTISSARASPSRSSANASGSSVGLVRGKDSPGQRMVDEFLNSRKSMSTTPQPAFI